MSRLSRLVLSDRYFFVTCNPPRTRGRLEEGDLEILARVIQARWEQHGSLLTAWVFLPDHWHAILSPRYPKSVSLVMESIKVSSTRQINARRGEAGQLWQGRFFDRALRTVKEYWKTVEYVHLNAMRRGLVKRAENWKWSSVHEYASQRGADTWSAPTLRIDPVRIPTDEKARI